MIQHITLGTVRNWRQRYRLFMSSEGIFMSSEMGSRVTVLLFTHDDKKSDKNTLLSSSVNGPFLSAKKCTILTKCKFIV